MPSVGLVLLVTTSIGVDGGDAALQGAVLLWYNEVALSKISWAAGFGMLLFEAFPWARPPTEFGFVAFDVFPLIATAD